MALDSDKDFRAVIHSINAGQTTIKLKVEVRQNERSNRFSQLEDEAQIQVIGLLIKNNDFNTLNCVESIKVGAKCLS